MNKPTWARTDAGFIHQSAKKLKCIQYLGGSCVECSENLMRKPWLTHFHHKNRKEKAFGIMRQLGSGYGLTEEVKAELDKCALLCSNCHLTEHFEVDRFAELRDQIEAHMTSLDFIDICQVTLEEKARIRELTQQGLTLQAIAEVTGWCTLTVSRHAPEDALFGNDLTRKITDKEILFEVSQGLSMREIADKYGMSYKVVWKRFKILKRHPTKGVDMLADGQE